MQTNKLRFALLSLSLSALVAAASAQYTPGSFGTSVTVESHSRINGVNSYGDTVQLFKEGDSQATSTAAGASANAHAELGKGLLHVSTSAAGTAYDPINYTNYSDMNVARAEAWIWDTVTIFPDMDVSRVPFDMSFDLDGSATGLGGAEMQVWMDNQTVYYNTGKGNLNYTWVPLTPLVGSYTFRLAVMVKATSAAYNFEESTSHGAFADYGNTLHIRWNLPRGWSYTSASGVFHPENTAQAVPEPASIAALGAGAFAMLRRRRR